MGVNFDESRKMGVGEIRSFNLFATTYHSQNIVEKIKQRSENIGHPRFPDIVAPSKLLLPTKSTSVQ